MAILEFTSEKIFSFWIILNGQEADLVVKLCLGLS